MSFAVLEEPDLDWGDSEDDELAYELTHAAEHSDNIYASDGPGDGRSWPQYFTDIRTAGAKEETPQREASRVLQRAKPISASDAPGGAGTLARRLLAAGWDVTIQHARMRISAVIWKSDSEEGAKEQHRIGDIRFADYETDLYFITGVKRAGGQALVCDVTFERREGKSVSFQIAQTHDPILGYEVRVRSRGARPQNDIEKEDGIMPPLGFDEWLSITCPKPKKGA